MSARLIVLGALALTAGLTACGSGHSAGLPLPGMTESSGGPDHTWQGSADDFYSKKCDNVSDAPAKSRCWTPFKLHLSSFSPIKGEIRWFNANTIDAKNGMTELCRGTWTETQKLPDSDTGRMVRIVHEHITSSAVGQECHDNDWKLEIINKTGSYSSELQDSLKPGVFGGGDALGTGMGGLQGTDMQKPTYTLDARGFIDEGDFEK